MAQLTRRAFLAGAAGMAGAAMLGCSPGKRTVPGQAGSIDLEVALQGDPTMEPIAAATATPRTPTPTPPPRPWAPRYVAARGDAARDPQ